MASLIASDDNNPQFTGAHDPDARLSVRFYQKVLPNDFETAKQERPIFYECDFVRIDLPGNQLNNYDGFVNETHKQRFPKQWAFYQNNKKAEAQIMGTPIEEWNVLNRAQAEELRALKFYTVESIASCSDQQLQAIGMKAGMQPYAFREKANTWLKRASSDAAATADAAEKEALRAQNETANKAIEELRAQMAELTASKPGRKPKQPEAA